MMIFRGHNSYGGNNKRISLDNINMPPPVLRTAKKWVESK